MHKERGFAHLILLLVVILLIGAGIYFIKQGKFNLPSIPFLQNGPKVDLKTEYKNPFNKETQFVNPFNKYKNPFVVNR
ncbi:MAG: hypothetical protein Q7R49_03625 [Candidatus Daviesbacteria bacterium]|nr:hypothetical protein [Candidatus Daviesbacteria bacterium]